MADGKGVLMNEQGVQALTNLAKALPLTVEEVKNAKIQIETSFEEKKELLGPHSNEIENIIDAIDDAQNAGGGNIIKVQLGIVKAASKLSAILSKGLNTGGGSSNP